MDDDCLPTQRISTTDYEEAPIANLYIDGKTIPIYREYKITIGRHPKCDIWVNNETVSRRHAELEVDNKTIFIKDMNSMNKTKINNLVLIGLNAYQVRHNDRLKFGDAVGIMKFYDKEGDTLPNTIPKNQTNNGIIPEIFGSAVAHVTFNFHHCSLSFPRQ